MIVGRILQIRLRGHAADELTKSAWERIDAAIKESSGRARTQFMAVLAPDKEQLLQTFRRNIYRSFIDGWFGDLGLKIKHLEFTYSTEDLAPHEGSTRVFEFYGTFGVEVSGWVSASSAED